MKRRDFLKTSAVGLSVPSTIFGGTYIKTNNNDPLILSTWNHGLPANDAAWKVLKSGGSAMDAAEAGAKVPEADPKSTSVGFGGLPDEQGNVTLDACVMDKNGNAGSVAFIQNIKHPVSVARKVMEETKHVMLVGEGARQFAISKGFEEINLLTKESQKAWEKWKKEQREMTPHETHDTISVLVHDKNAGRMHIHEWRAGGEEDASTVRKPVARVRQHKVEHQISAGRISQEMRHGILAASGVSTGRDTVTQVDKIVVALESGPGKPFRLFREAVADQGVERTRLTVARNCCPLP